jgi:hypothetical protein
MPVITARDAEACGEKHHNENGDVRDGEAKARNIVNPPHERRQRRKRQKEDVSPIQGTVSTKWAHGGKFNISPRKEKAFLMAPKSSGNFARRRVLTWAIASSRFLPLTDRPPGGCGPGFSPHPDALGCPWRWFRLPPDQAWAFCGGFLRLSPIPAVFSSVDVPYGRGALNQPVEPMATRTPSTP